MPEHYRAHMMVLLLLLLVLQLPIALGSGRTPRPAPHTQQAIHPPTWAHQVLLSHHAVHCGAKNQLQMHAFNRDNPGLKAGLACHHRHGV
jgi:hypothetical protein